MEAERSRAEECNHERRSDRRHVDRIHRLHTAGAGQAIQPGDHEGGEREQDPGHQAAADCSSDIQRVPELVHGSQSTRLDRAFTWAIDPVTCPIVSTSPVGRYVWTVDPLACLLDGPRARGAFVLRSSLTPPWSIRIEDQAPLTLVVVVRGGAWITVSEGDQAGIPGELQAVDVAVLRGPAPYLVNDDGARPAQVYIDVHEQCHSTDPRRPSPMGPQGVRFWGNSPDGETMLLTTTYRNHQELSRHLLRVLPPMLVLGSEEWSDPLVSYLVQEAGRDEPGQEAVLDRLTDLLLIAVLRNWFWSGSRPSATSPNGA